MISLKKIILSILIIVFAKSTGQELTFDKKKNYSIKNGLSNYKVQSVFKDQLGFVWIGTQDGLNRFDGTNFLIYKNNPNDIKSISDGNILSIVQDKDGLLWIGIDGGGVNILNPKTNTIKKLFDGLVYKKSKLQYVKNIFIDRNNIVWISTWGGLIHYNPKTNKYFVFKHNTNRKNSICNSDVKQVIEDKDGLLWIATSGGLSMLNSKTMIFTNYYDSNFNNHNQGNNIRSLYFDSNQQLWIGTTNGTLVVLDKEKKEFKAHTLDPKNPRSNIVNSFYEDKKHNLWIGTEEGIFITQVTPSKTNKYIFKNTNVTTQDAHSIFEDENGLFWYGTQNEGFYIINPQKNSINTLYIENSHPISKQIRTIIGGKNNTIWFGSYGNGIINYNPITNKYLQYLKDTPIKDSKIENLHLDHNNNMWIGTFSDGVYQYDFTTKKLYHILKNIRINSVYEDSNHLIWIGTNLGLQFYDLNQKCLIPAPLSYRLSKSLLNDYIFFITSDKHKNIWISSLSKGVFLINLKNNIIKRYDYKNTNANDRYNFISFTEDNKGIYYLGTRNGGIIKIYPNGKITNLSSQNGFLSNTITGLLSDIHNNLWVSTTKGINMIKNSHPTTFRNFDETDGVKGFEFYRGSFYKDSLGWMYFGGTNGINYFHPDSIKQNKNEQHTIIYSLSVFNKEYKTDTLIFYKKNITLSHKQNFVNFKFSSIGYYQQEKFHYKYKLEGVDKNWIYSGTENSVTYTNLNPGKYTFFVNSTNNHGIWANQPTALQINILPPFWKTWWFYTIISTIFIGSIFFIIKSREQKLIYEKEIAQFKLAALGSQMNPHFIFNALNSIQHFIIKNESEFALNYLSRFAKLVRRILENPTKDGICLKDEIAFLENYLQIESLRFDNKLNYEITFEPSIEPEYIEIPSLLIQPYVENAVIHGLMHLETEPKLTIRFSLFENKLKCVILDNGIGRKKAAILKEKLNKQHQSLGMSITQKRLELLNKNKGLEVILKITDVTNNDIISGTCVELLIPIDYHA